MKAPQPTFSIVVPTFERPRQVGRLLEALACLDYPRDGFEVILVDDGSSRPLDSVVDPFRDRLNVTLLRQPNAGPAPARQRGIDVAHGRYLAFLDDDCEPASDWLRVLEEQFARHPHSALGGRTLNALPDNLYSTASQAVLDYLYSRWNANPEAASYFATNNLAFPSAEFRDIGGLDTTWSIQGGEDRDLCRRWQQHGLVMRFVPEMIIYHSHKLRFATFFRQHFHYGRGAFVFHGGDNCSDEVGQRAGPGFYVSLLLFPFSHFPLFRACRLSVLVLVSQLAILAGFLAQWPKGGGSDRQRRDQATELSCPSAQSVSQQGVVIPRDSHEPTLRSRP
jgi:glycosyltransferase involved in cell wall biosynthesis